MPTYEYVCRDCGHHLEVVQSFRDDPLTVCGRCDGSLRKVFSPAGVIFKGSGYYVTDSRPKVASGDGGDKTGSGGTEAGDKGKEAAKKGNSSSTDKAGKDSDRGAESA